MGRLGTSVEPGDRTSRLLEDYLPGGHAFAAGHDQVVGLLWAFGVPDKYANKPTMPLTYLAEVSMQFAQMAGARGAIPPSAFNGCHG